MPHAHRNEALTHGKSTKCKKLPRKEKPGKVTPPRPVAVRRRHPPLLLLRLCSPKPPRQTRAQPVPRRQRGEAGQLRSTPCAQGPAAPEGTYRAGAPPRPPLPAVSVGAAAAAPRGVPQRGRSARRGAGESAQPGRCGFPLRFVSLLLQTTPANPRSRAVLRRAAVRGLSPLPPGSPISFPAGSAPRARGTGRKCAHFASRMCADLLVVVPESRESSSNTNRACS